MFLQTILPLAHNLYVFRCVTGLIAITQGEEMDKYIKESPQEKGGHYKVRVKNAKFYGGATLLLFLEVVKRLTNISQEEDFEPLSYKLAARHPITRVAIEELGNKVLNSTQNERRFSDNRLISSLLLRRMFAPSLSFFDYDDDNWHY